ncbi:hypothetical protein GMB34_14420 [Turicibacter sanguinis]|nr:hypothetical protein [Turicibacter sanguinis]MTN83152.1 hypothetical protein [Turicibacter sanguinis]MTN88212.1 hypothetical protein [Turicibacter sanguinis]MTN89167.1 hypothetical protein [Turicibacter sanguinis]MTN93618.1 hypothetical protein [Turicibacter sanguinis]
MTSTFLFHYKFKCKFLGLFIGIGEGTMEVDIENHTVDRLSSEDIKQIEELVKMTNKGYQANVLNFNKLIA